MKPIARQLMDHYLPALDAAKVPAAARPDYAKWLRFYLDFCLRYAHPPRDADSLEPFLQKLTAKGQSVDRQKQAAAAISIYYRLMASWLAQPAASEPPPGNLAWEDAYRQLKESIVVRQYSTKTLKTYRSWVRVFQGFLRDKPPKALTSKDVQDFLTDLAVRKRVVATTQNQALNALLFFFRHVLKREFELGDKVVRARKKRYIPVVLTRQEVDRIVAAMTYPYSLLTQMLYGCGLRLSEALNLRVQCFNLDEMLLTIHDGKGKKDRVVPLPKVLKPALENQFERLRLLHEEDLHMNFDGAFMPGAINSKWRSAAKEFIWQWFFPAYSLTFVPSRQERRRWHLHETQYRTALWRAVQEARLTKRVTAHTFRHSFASHLLRANYDIRTIQQLLGHSDIRTTMIYTHTVQSRTIKEVGKRRRGDRCSVSGDRTKDCRNSEIGNVKFARPGGSAKGGK